MDEVEIRPPLSAGNMDLKKGTWSAEEDQKLIAYIRRYGIWNWAEMSKAVGLSRSGQSCRLRWMNYLRPDIKHGNFTEDEEETIVNLYEKVGSRRSTMAESLPSRTDDEIKSCFDTILRNKALQTEELRDDQTPELESKEMTTTSDNNLSNTKLLMTENAPRGTEKGLRQGRWTVEEDKKLIAYIKSYGIWNWRALPKFAGLARSGKSCRLRWMNYLRPSLKRGKFSVEEEETICRLHEILGNKWSVIASHLPGRTDNEIKNYFKTYLKKGVYKKNEEWEDALQGTVNEISPIPTITYSDEATKYFDEEASSPHGGPSVDSLVEKAIKSDYYSWLPFLDHKNSELESREIPSSSSNNLSALLMSPKESNCRSNMEIPNYNLIKEEIINNGNQIKLVEKMVGLLRSSRKIEQQFSVEEEAYVLAADDEDASSPSHLLKSVVQLSLSPIYLSRLNMPQSNPEELWAGKQSLVNLKSIDLNHSKLTKIPDLSEAQKLGRLNLRGCLNLLETSSIQYLTKLELLNLKGCKSLKNLPCMKGLSVLTTVILSDCSNLKQLPELSRSIENLYLDGTAIEELPSSIGCLSGLVKLDLRNCTRLRLLPSSISELQLLEYLDISGCSLLLQLLEMDWNDM